MIVKILIDEDEDYTAVPYKIALEMNNHEVVITNNGEECLKHYRDVLERMPKQYGSPFDVIILDCRMPDKDGVLVAKEIFAMNLDQRIAFASAYSNQALADSRKKLKQALVFPQKPFELDEPVGIIERVNHHS